MGKISLSGIGIASGSPDIAIVNVMIATYDKNSREARKQYNVLANKVIEGSKGEPFSIEAKDIHHGAPNVSPQYRTDKTRSENKIEGYRAYGVVTVKIRDLDAVDNFVDACSELGDEVGVQNVCFDVEDKTALYNAARKAAVQDVRQKAELYCEEAGVQLGDLETLSEHNYGGGVRAASASRAMVMESSFGGGADDSTNTEAGETQVTMNISVEWGIHNRR